MLLFCRLRATIGEYVRQFPFDFTDSESFLRITQQRSSSGVGDGSEFFSVGGRSEFSGVGDGSEFCGI